MVQVVIEKYFSLFPKWFEDFFLSLTVSLRKRKRHTHKNYVPNWKGFIYIGIAQVTHCDYDSVTVTLTSDLIDSIYGNGSDDKVATLLMTLHNLGNTIRITTQRNVVVEIFEAWFVVWC